ncbi:hypothetical protein TNCV_3733451 [Trichonephila clavipes]|nr:hypothetical protein TNCV_3733451 [Trichonephila clavipes]
MNKIRKTPAGLDSPTALEEFVAVDGNNACIEPFKVDKEILKFVQSSKHVIDADSDDENEMNNAAPVPISPEMRNIMKSIRSCLEAHSNMEMNNITDDIEQCDAEKDNAKKNIRLLSKNSINVLFFKKNLKILY